MSIKKKMADEFLEATLIAIDRFDPDKTCAIWFASQIADIHDATDLLISRRVYQRNDEALTSAYEGYYEMKGYAAAIIEDKTSEEATLAGAAAVAAVRAAAAE